MGVYSEVALCMYPAQSDEETETAYKTWMIMNRARITDLIIHAKLTISQKFEVDIFASGNVKWYGDGVDALVKVLNDELIDIPFLSWEVVSVSEDGYVDSSSSNQAEYRLGTRTTITFDGEDVE
jgi:hypothetical protein